MKKLSVIIPVHDQAEALEQNLPIFLQYAAEQGHEVIVVDDMSSDNTPDVLQHMCMEHPTLYTTFLPVSTVVNPSRLRLALSVGIKAAHNDYIVLANIHRPPVSEEWLNGLAEGEAALVYSSKDGHDVTHVVATSLDDLSDTVLMAERKSGHGHDGTMLKRRRGLYDALCVRREKAIDAVRLFDQPVSVGQCLTTRLRLLLGF